MSCSSTAIGKSGRSARNRDTRTILLTFGPDVQIRSEAKWLNGDVGGDSQRQVSLGRFV